MALSNEALNIAFHRIEALELERQLAARRAETEALERRAAEAEALAVEAETMACGTGIVASALIAAKLGQGRPPIDVSVAGGGLTVDFRLTDTGAEEVTLLGPAVHTFNGKLEYPGN